MNKPKSLQYFTPSLDNFRSGTARTQATINILILPDTRAYPVEEFSECK